MKKAGPLTLIYTNHQARDVFVIHPNTGFELALMTKSHDVAWCCGMATQDFLHGAAGEERPIRLDLLNECPHAQLFLHVSYAPLLGDAKKAVLLYDGRRIFLHTQKVEGQHR